MAVWAWEISSGIPPLVYNNYGLQWFIPYFIVVFIVAIPASIFEITTGQAYRGGAVIAYNNMNKHLKGTGLGLLFIGFFVNHHFVVILSWIMNYFRNSFTSPLPWTNRGEEVYAEVVGNPDPTAGSLSENGSQALSYTSYPSTALIDETVG